MLTIQYKVLYFDKYCTPPSKVQKCSKDHGETEHQCGPWAVESEAEGKYYIVPT